MQLLIDFENRLGKIKPMHSVGQPPINATNLSLCSYLQQAHIPYARLHDVGGPYGGSRYVDIHNIFPNFDADENHPASYDFEFTDHLLSEMHKYGLKPIYRLGETIENTVKHGFRPRYILDSEWYRRSCRRWFQIQSRWKTGPFQSRCCPPAGRRSRWCRQWWHRRIRNRRR